MEKTVMVSPGELVPYGSAEYFSLRDAAVGHAYKAIRESAGAWVQVWESYPGEGLVRIHVVTLDNRYLFIEVTGGIPTALKYCLERSDTGMLTMFPLTDDDKTPRVRW